ncbi:MAG: GNAT family N-acetyltransferase [Caulobacterales bacterium]|jgi:RimJ/RimL family protein N-acetyltransferase
MAPILEIGAARLRPLSMDDAAALHVGFSDPGLMTYWSCAPHATLAETAADVAWWVERNSDAAWAIEEGGAVLGRIGLYEIRKGVREVGVFLLREGQGRGLARAALDAIVQDGFSRLDLFRIAADVDPDNAPSIRLFERAGFVLEGRLKANWRTHLGLRDSLIYARFPQ